MNVKHLFALTLAAGLSANSMAETLYNLDIDNTASLTYSVDGNAQTGVSVTATESFKVDRKVIFTLTPSTAIPSAAVNTQQGTAYTLVNDSNSPIRFALSAIHKDNAETVTINGNTVTDTTPTATNAPTYTYYEETGAGSAFADTSNAQLTTGYIELAPSDGVAGGSDEAIIYVVATPVIGVNDDIFAHALTVTAQETAASATALNTTNGSSLSAGDTISADTGAWVSGETQTVLNADGVTRAGEGAIEITSADLSMTKTALVVSDPINGTANAKAIPGAVIQYTITVINAGSEDATNVVISDSLPANGFDLTDAYVELFSVTDDAGTTTNPTTGSGVAVTGNDVVFDAVTVPANDGANDGEVSVTITATLQ
jgi:uncharacterized repeat protein (TIGR01451 family)